MYFLSTLCDIHGSVANAVIYVAILSAFDVSNQRGSFNLVRQACKSISLV